MIILKEQMELTEELDPTSVLTKIKTSLDDEIGTDPDSLHTELASQNILRVYYDRKSLVSVQLDFEDEDIFIIEDYRGFITTADSSTVVKTVIDIIARLNYMKEV